MYIVQLFSPLRMFEFCSSSNVEVYPRGAIGSLEIQTECLTVCLHIGENTSADRVRFLITNCFK